MQKKKAVFFDIDGTLWNSDNRIPKSAQTAIRKLRRNGHLAFLCSGRCRSYIQDPELLSLGFDGIVSGCGTMIEYGGETVFYHRIEPELAKYTVKTVRRYGFRPILEGREYLYMDEAEFGQDFYGRKLKAEAGERLRSISDEWGRWEISKLSCATENADRETCFGALSPYYDFMIHNEAVVEIVPKGFHKGTGIEAVCRLLGMDLSDTIAVGDSANDLGMMQTAGTSVAMGNGSDAAKKAADYVTSSLEHDGIWNACSHLGLLE